MENFVNQAMGVFFDETFGGVVGGVRVDGVEFVH